MVRSQALACRTPQSALSAPTLRQLAIHNSEEEVVAQAVIILDKAMELFAPARRMSTDHVTEFAWQIMAQYPHESLADLNVFAKGCAMSKYDAGEYYASVDVPRLAKWWTKYMEEKSVARETQMHLDGAQRQRETEQSLAGLGLMDVVNKAVADGVKERAQERAERMKVLRLMQRVEVMTDDQLRQAWKEHGTQGRAIITAAAARRGLYGEELKAAQLQFDAQREAAQEAATKELDEAELQAGASEVTGAIPSPTEKRA